MSDPQRPYPLDHDGDGRRGGARKAPAQPVPDPLQQAHVVDPEHGLIAVPAEEVAARLAAGARLATDQDLRVAGVLTD